MSLPMARITLDTFLGPIVIQGDDRGLTGIDLTGSTPRKSARPRPASRRPPVLDLAAGQITEYLAGRRTIFDLPLVMDGTFFQLRAWSIIRDIPYGRTMSYGDIARRLGSLNKSRAVGGAAHANPFPLVIPCHRVIGGDGSLTGFGGGLAMKRKLLELEGIV